jgi:hypothetical protein
LLYGLLGDEIFVEEGVCVDTEEDCFAEAECSTDCCCA